MIINERVSKKVYNKLLKMKEISRLNVSKRELNNFFHTINVINTLDRDENIVGTNVLSKYKILKQLEPLVLPAEITISNSIKQINMLDDCYKNYTAAEYFEPTIIEVDEDGVEIEEGVEAKGKTQKKQIHVEILSAADFNVISDAIAGAFKKTAEFTDVETLKVCAAIDNYVDREMQHGKCAPKTENYVPVELGVGIAQSRYLTEDADEEILLWFENKVFRALKK